MSFIHLYVLSFYVATTTSVSLCFMGFKHICQERNTTNVTKHPGHAFLYNWSQNAQKHVNVVHTSLRLVLSLAVGVFVCRILA